MEGSIEDVIQEVQQHCGVDPTVVSTKRALIRDRNLRSRWLRRLKVKDHVTTKHKYCRGQELRAGVRTPPRSTLSFSDQRYLVRIQKFPVDDDKEKRHDTTRHQPTTTNRRLRLR
jgi:hypothetical protein